MTRTPLVAALLITIALLAAACGSDDADPISQADIPDQEQPQDPNAPIPVEPDGGIGDGAEPLPGADDDAASGDWHGAELAETNCPDVIWQRVETTAFSFSLPVDFVDQQAQGIDSEVGLWKTDSAEVLFDYGWFSGPLDQQPGDLVVVPIDYSGFLGTHVVAAAENNDSGRNIVGVHFPELVLDVGPQWNKLTMVFSHDQPEDEIIGRCVVGSIEWNITPG